MTALTPEVKARQKTARARAVRIRDGITSYIHTLGDIAIAHAEGDWKTLGYESWDDYVAKEFSADRVRLPVPQRQKAVEELRLAGLSNRAIAAAVNVAETTVRRDLAATNVAPIEGEIVDPPARSPLVEAMTGAIEDAEKRAEDHLAVAGPGEPADLQRSAEAAGAVGHPVPAAPDSGVAAPAEEVLPPASSEPDPEPAAGEGEQGGPANSPAGPPCERCDGEILPGQAKAGYKRCDDCDPEGDHQADELGECGRCKTHCPTCEQPLAVAE
jgi:hypothetical protein